MKKSRYWINKIPISHITNVCCNSKRLLKNKANFKFCKLSIHQ